MSIKYIKHRGKHCGLGSDCSYRTGAVWSGSTLSVYVASNISVDDKNKHFVIMRFKG